MKFVLLKNFINENKFIRKIRW